MSTERFADEAFQAITFYGGRDDSRGDRQTESRAVELIRADQHGEELTRMAARGSLAEYAIKFGFAA